MKTMQYIWSEGKHKWGVVSRDPERPPYLIDTNEYLIVDGDQAMITDPGGMEIFPAVFSAISREFNPEQIQYIFSSHQDPDIISSLGLWLEVNKKVRCYLSWLWITFVPHFGGFKDTFISMPDDGREIELGGIRLQAIPAHYLHSSGNFNLYDPKAKILFSGDIGAALLPHGTGELYVKNFDEHLQYIKTFHERWMSSNDARLAWCERVSKLKIDMLCPQHGMIYTGKDVERFINWFSELQVGQLGIHTGEERRLAQSAAALRARTKAEDEESATGGFLAENARKGVAGMLDESLL